MTLGMHDNKDLKPSSDRVNNLVDSASTFKLRGLPAPLQLDVIRKLPFHEWSFLRQCSRDTYHLCENTITQMSFQFDMISVFGATALIKAEGHRGNKSYYMTVLPYGDEGSLPFSVKSEKLYVYSRLDRAHLKIFYDRILAKKLTCRRIFFQHDVLCSLDELIALMQAVDARELVHRYQINSQLLDFFYVKQLSGTFLFQCPVTDNQLLTLQAGTLLLPSDTVSARAICEFIKSWQRGERELINATFEFSQINAIDYFRPFVRQLELYEYGSVRDNVDNSMHFMVFRPHDMENPLKLKITSKCIRIRKCDGDLSTTVAVPCDMVLDTWGYCLACANFGDKCVCK